MFEPVLNECRRLYPRMGDAERPRQLYRWYRYVNPVGLAYNLYTHRQLVRQLTRREIMARYRGSYLGMVWSLLLPVLMLCVYTFVFSVIFKSRWPNQQSDARGEFAAALFAGLIAFGVFAECVNRAPSLVPSNPNYVKKVRFPLELLPVTALGAALFQAGLSCFVLVGVLSVTRLSPPSGAVLYLPLAVLPLVALVLGASWFLASLGVYVRDVGYLTAVGTQMFLFLTPLFYPLEAVPEALRRILLLNPLTVVVDGFRRTLVWNLPLPWQEWAFVTLGSVLVMLLGYTWFMKTKPGFADVL